MANAKVCDNCGRLIKGTSSGYREIRVHPNPIDGEKRLPAAVYLKMALVDSKDQKTLEDICDDCFDMLLDKAATARWNSKHV